MIIIIIIIIKLSIVTLRSVDGSAFHSIWRQSFPISSLCIRIKPTSSSSCQLVAPS